MLFKSHQPTTSVYIMASLALAETMAVKFASMSNTNGQSSTIIGSSVLSVSEDGSSIGCGMSPVNTSPSKTPYWDFRWQRFRCALIDEDVKDLPQHFTVRGVNRVFDWGGGGQLFLCRVIDSRNQCSAYKYILDQISLFCTKVYGLDQMWLV